MATEKKLKLVSACLAGVHCRFDCQAKARQEIIDMVMRGEALPVCPEQLGGLPTPRAPSEIQPDGRVLTNHGADVTKAYELGAQEALKLAQLSGCTEAYLKSKSPMCGSDQIYDGTFSQRLVSGDGVFVKLLKKLGLKIHSVD